MEPTTVALYIGIFIAIVCVIDAARWNRGAPQTLHRFFLLDGRLSLPKFALTISAANLSLGNFIIFIAIWGYNFGATGLAVFIVNLALNVAGYLYYLRVFQPYIEDRKNSGTIHEYIATTYTRPGQERLGELARLFASLVTVSCLALAILFELSLAVDLLGPTSPLDKLYMFAGLAALIALFTAHGGFRTLFFSDGLNGALLALGSICLVAVMVWQTGAHPNTSIFAEGPSWAGLKQIGWPAIVSICIIGSGWMLVAMDQWQRSCASRSYKISWFGTFWYFFVVLIAACIYAAWGAFDANVMPSVNPNAQLSGSTNPLLDIMNVPENGGMGRFLVTMAITGLVFAAVSTTNTFLNVLSHSLTSDVVVSLIARRDLHSFSPDTDRFFVSIARAIIVSVVAVLVVIYAIFTQSGLLRDPLSFFFIAYSVQFALLAPMALSRLPKAWRPGIKPVILSLALGFVTALTVGFGSWVLLQGEPRPVLFLMPGDWITLAPVVTLVLGLVPLLVAIPWNRDRRPEQ
jgi:Na+/proline symporter